MARHGRNHPLAAYVGGIEEPSESESDGAIPPPPNIFISQSQKDMGTPPALFAEYVRGSGAPAIGTIHPGPSLGPPRAIGLVDEAGSRVAIPTRAPEAGM